MRKCEFCGALLQDKDKYCPQCGSKVENIDKEIQAVCDEHTGHIQKVKWLIFACLFLLISICIINFIFFDPNTSTQAVQKDNDKLNVVMEDPYDDGTTEVDESKETEDESIKSDQEIDYIQYLKEILIEQKRMSSEQTIIIDKDSEDIIEVSVGNDSPGKFTASGWYRIDKKTLEIIDIITGEKLTGASGTDAEEQENNTQMDKFLIQKTLEWLQNNYSEVGITEVEYCSKKDGIINCNIHATEFSAIVGAEINTSTKKVDLYNLYGRIIDSFYIS